MKIIFPLSSLYESSALNIQNRKCKLSFKISFFSLAIPQNSMLSCDHHDKHLIRGNRLRKCKIRWETELSVETANNRSDIA